MTATNMCSNFGGMWDSSPAKLREEDGKLHNTAHANMWYMLYVHNQKVHGRFCGLHLKKGNGRHGEQALFVARI